MPIENFRKVLAFNPMMPTEPELPMSPAVNALDTPEAQARLRMIEGWWYQARQAQAEARHQMALDQDFYDGLQWRDDDKLILIDRGQVPLVFNRIKSALDWIIGPATE